MVLGHFLGVEPLLATGGGVEADIIYWEASVGLSRHSHEVSKAEVTTITELCVLVRDFCFLRHAVAVSVGEKINDDMDEVFILGLIIQSLRLSSVFESLKDHSLCKCTFNAMWKTVQDVDK